MTSSISTQNKLITSSLQTTESINLIQKEIYTNTTVPITKNSYINNTTTSTNTSTLITNSNVLNQPIDNNNCIIFEDDNKIAPLEYTLTENNGLYK